MKKGKRSAKEFREDEMKNSAVQEIDERSAGPAGCEGSRGENGRKQKEMTAGEGRSQSQQIGWVLAGDAPPTPEPEDDFSGAPEKVLAFALSNDFLTLAFDSPPHRSRNAGRRVRRGIYAGWRRNREPWMQYRERCTEQCSHQIASASYDVC